jgi:hypothetical protein
MEPDMKVTGKMIFSMDKEKKHGLMDQSMKDNISKERNMDLELMPGMMVLSMKVNGMKIKLEE